MALFRKNIPRRTTVISFSLFACMVGLFGAYYGVGADIWMFAIVLCCVPLLKKAGYGRLFAAACMFLLLGVWRGSAVMDQLRGYEPLYGEAVVVRARVADDAGFNEQRNQTEFHIHKISVNNMSLIGKLQVATKDDPQVSRGDTVVVRGKLKESKGTSRQGVLSLAEVRIVQKNTSPLESIRTRFFESVSKILPEPQASLGIGYLVGLRVNIPQELSDQLAVTGLTHIIAVSGYNVTIIVRAVRRLLGRRSAYQSLVFSLLLIGGFLLVAGSSPSINRAAVVCVFSLFAWYYGRTLKPLLLLLLSGVCTAFVNPLYIWGDPGWWLSFLAFAGVLIVAPLVFARFFTRRPPGVIAQILLETLCAQVCTTSYTMYLFGGVSVIAPLANLLVLPVIPFIMLLLFALGIVGFFAPHIAAIGAIIPSSLLTLQIWMVEKMSRISWAHYEVAIPAWVMIALFVFLTVAVVHLHYRVKVGKDSAANIDSYNLL